MNEQPSTTLKSLAHYALKRHELRPEEFAKELEKHLDALVSAHFFNRSPETGLALFAAAMLVRDEGMAVLTRPSPAWQELEKAIARAINAI